MWPEVGGAGLTRPGSESIVMVTVPPVQLVVVVASMVWPEPEPAETVSVAFQVQPVPPETETSEAETLLRSQPLLAEVAAVSGAPSLPLLAGSGMVTRRYPSAGMLLVRVKETETEPDWVA